MAIIEVEHLTKEYRLGQVHSLKDSARQLLAKLRGIPVEDRPRFKALDDVHFSVEEGQVLGIIGTNGAGKSTLLKMLAGISVPSVGTVSVHGSVAPLIEVGAGLVPDLTGRENIYVNASILGMSRAETTRRLDEIVEFAELEEFVDTQVKRYSSGMKVRLGFAIATSVDAEILIVDEVLAVGDLAFQRKCFARLEELIKGRGRTVLVVSHNIRQIERMCDRAILLDHGRLLMDGSPLDVCNAYYEQTNKQVMENAKRAEANCHRVNSSGEVEVVSIDVMDAQGNPVEEIDSGSPLRIRVRFELRNKLDDAEIVVGTHGTDFVYLTAASTATLERRLNYEPGVHEIECVISSFPLVTGIYGVRFAVADGVRRFLYTGEMLKTFAVRPMPLEGREPPARTLNIGTSWIVQGQAGDVAKRA